jgi:hypothetical protein
MNARRPAGKLLIAAMGVALLAAPLTVHADTTNASIRAVSTSHQFTAYARQPLLSAALCVFAERVKREWLAQLDATDSWRDPVIFIIQDREPSRADAPATALEIFQTDLHLKYQIRCLVPPPLNEASLLDAAVEALCAEFANRAQPVPKGKPYIAAPVPPWLVQGLAQSLRGPNEALLAVARRSAAAGRPQEAMELLAKTELPGDPLDRQLFQANAWLFTEGLLGLPDGSGKLQRYLTELGAQKSATNAFWTVYRQDFPETVALEKWWSLQRAQRTAMRVAENLSATETSHRLGEILRVKLTVSVGKKGHESVVDQPLSQLWTYYQERWLNDVLRNKLVALQALRAQAHPRYQDVIGEYSDAIGWLLDKKLNRFRRAVKRADGARAGIDRESRETTAYLDRAERIYTPQDPAKLFDGYFQTLDEFQNLQQQRRSPISDYLDQFDH